MTEPVVLALDTSTEQCSVAIVAGERRASRAVVTPREHAQRILGLITEVLDELQLQLADVTALVCGHGPGSFTGVRIGVSVAQGLAFSQPLPVYPVNTLAALAQQAIRKHKAKIIVSAIDARMNEVYLASFRNEQGLAVAVQPPQMAPLEPLAANSWWPGGSVAGAGTGWQAYADALDPGAEVEILHDVTLPLAEDMLSLALAMKDQGIEPVKAAGLEPLYVRNEVAWKKLPGR
ncbi:tRNA (adenosine(37)-N6)-threonylcarbamoyltransferase complex dimerization subunit type 1 TsaB [Pseudidiomarina sp.]|uniref:tRNA (adenosine(37)-N6)-threonylcarbamoyltransferase complex dimerization subunit type 1 TsaB n=1 Tax=Pseudidiomarina sp. TaxID=2081707 RepID=UPI00299EAB1F|nr:tRNA (adenosine(37)-N6)-threonylcarbamoyltransferase complex dimerization subunit type 1 TsaB [Pseudidiomarina sp.]MDX1705158.1 tRNA (adenosine(37)-N6)-threonylcarbamoyltransferase complex dimerization subunit type 1 TsaB [Pseudidiomarina sp.]